MSLSNSTDHTISKVDACNAAAHLLTTDYGHDRATVTAWSAQIADLVSNTVEDLADGVTILGYAWVLADTIHGAIAKQFDADTDMVENLMDRLGVPGLLDLISSLCDAKSEHILASYSDRELAERWGNAQMRLDRVAAIIREYKLEG